jgi:hypothetical protein
MRLSSRSLMFGLVAIWPVVCPAQQLKIKEDQGHISPVRAKITFANDRTRDVVISAVGSETFDRFYTHVLFVRTEGGASKRKLWIDQIKAIRQLSPRPRSEFTIDLKDGSSFDAQFVHTGGGMSDGCPAFYEIAEAKDACSFVVITNSDESIERINLMSLKAVDFYPLPRKDKAGNLMFDTWRYSPLTGEKLPPVADNADSPVK